MIDHFPRGSGYFLRGLQLIRQPTLRWFVIIPLLVNITLFASLSYYAYAQFQELLQGMLDWVPDWEWLQTLLKGFFSLVFGLLLLIVYMYTFTLIANFIAAPFNGLLAEKVELHLTGNAPPEEPIMHMVWRSFGRELRKVVYFVPRLILVLFLSFIPPFNLIAPLIGFAWAAWSMAIQYLDYPADNHQLSFQDFRRQLETERVLSLGFGSTVMLFTLIPVVNFIAMPAAICGATALWVEQMQVQKEQTETEPPT